MLLTTTTSTLKTSRDHLCPHLRINCCRENGPTFPLLPRTKWPLRHLPCRLEHSCHHYFETPVFVAVVSFLVLLKIQQPITLLLLTRRLGVWQRPPHPPRILRHSIPISDHARCLQTTTAVVAMLCHHPLHFPRWAQDHPQVQFLTLH